MFTNGAVVNAKSKNQAAAQKWISFLTSSDDHGRAPGSLPRWELPPVADESQLAPYLDAGSPANRQAVFTSLEATVLPPVIERQQEMQDIVTEELTSAAAGRKPVATGARRRTEQGQRTCSSSSIRVTARPARVSAAPGRPAPYLRDQEA